MAPAPTPARRISNWASASAPATAPRMSISSFISTRTPTPTATPAPAAWVSTTFIVVWGFYIRCFVKLVLDRLKLGLFLETGGAGGTGGFDETAEKR